MDRIDENKDAFVDMSELKNWISFTQRRYIEDDVNRQWKQHNPENAEKLHWEVSSLLIFIFKKKHTSDTVEALNKRVEFFVCAQDIRVSDSQ